jgi:hypothetical protein
MSASVSGGRERSRRDTVRLVWILQVPQPAGGIVVRLEAFETESETS